MEINSSKLNKTNSLHKANQINNSNNNNNNNTSSKIKSSQNTIINKHKHTLNKLIEINNIKTKQTNNFFYSKFENEEKEHYFNSLEDIKFNKAIFLLSIIIQISFIIDAYVLYYESKKHLYLIFIILIALLIDLVFLISYFLCESHNSLKPSNKCHHFFDRNMIKIMKFSFYVIYTCLYFYLCMVFIPDHNEAITIGLYSVHHFYIFISYVILVRNTSMLIFIIINTLFISMFVISSLFSYTLQIVFINKDVSLDFYYKCSDLTNYSDYLDSTSLNKHFLYNVLTETNLYNTSTLNFTELFDDLDKEELNNYNSQLQIKDNDSDNYNSDVSSITIEDSIKNTPDSDSNQNSSTSTDITTNTYELNKIYVDLVNLTNNHLNCLNYFSSNILKFSLLNPFFQIEMIVNYTKTKFIIKSIVCCLVSFIMYYINFSLNNYHRGSFNKKEKLFILLNYYKSIYDNMLGKVVTFTDSNMITSNSAFDKEIFSDTNNINNNKVIKLNSNININNVNNIENINDNCDEYKEEYQLCDNKNNNYCYVKNKEKKSTHIIMMNSECRFIDKNSNTEDLRIKTKRISKGNKTTDDNNANSNDIIYNDYYNNIDINSYFNDFIKEEEDELRLSINEDKENCDLNNGGQQSLTQILMKDRNSNDEEFNNNNNNSKDNNIENKGYGYLIKNSIYNAIINDKDTNCNKIIGYNCNNLSKYDYTNTNNDLNYLNSITPAESEFRCLGIFKKLNNHYKIYFKKTMYINDNHYSYYYSLIFEDITNIKKLESIYSETKVKQKLFSKMVHEFKTPLIVIKSLISELNEPDIEDKEKISAYIYYLSDYITFLINDIIYYSNNKKIIIQSEEIDLYELFEFCEGVSKSLLAVMPGDKHNIDFNCHIDETINNYIILSDKTKLKQVMLNLISNSVKFTKQGEISIKAEVFNNQKDYRAYLKISVEDTGIGIKEQDLQKINEDNDNDKIISINSDYAYNQMGTGLGLGITKALIKAMNHKLTFFSVFNKGTKTEIIISLSEKANRGVSIRSISNNNIKNSSNYNLSVNSINSSKIRDSKKIITRIDDSGIIHKVININNIYNLNKKSNNSNLSLYNRNNTNSNNNKTNTNNNNNNNNTTNSFSSKQDIKLIDYKNNIDSNLENSYYNDNANNLDIYEYNHSNIIDNYNSSNNNNNNINKINQSLLSDQTIKLQSDKYRNSFSNINRLNSFKKINVTSLNNKSSLSPNIPYNEGLNSSFHIKKLRRYSSISSKTTEYLNKNSNNNYCFSKVYTGYSGSIKKAFVNDNNTITLPRKSSFTPINNLASNNINSYCSYSNSPISSFDINTNKERNTPYNKNLNYPDYSNNRISEIKIKDYINKLHLSNNHFNNNINNNKDKKNNSHSNKTHNIEMRDTRVLKVIKVPNISTNTDDDSKFLYNNNNEIYTQTKSNRSVGRSSNKYKDTCISFSPHHERGKKRNLTHVINSEYPLIKISKHVSFKKKTKVNSCMSSATTQKIVEAPPLYYDYSQLHYLNNNTDNFFEENVKKLSSLKISEIEINDKSSLKNGVINENPFIHVNNNSNINSNNYGIQANQVIKMDFNNNQDKCNDELFVNHLKTNLGIKNSKGYNADSTIKDYDDEYFEAQDIQNISTPYLKNPNTNTNKRENRINKVKELSKTRAIPADFINNNCILSFNNDYYYNRCLYSYKPNNRNVFDKKKYCTMGLKPLKEINYFNYEYSFDNKKEFIESKNTNKSKQAIREIFEFNKDMEDNNYDKNNKDKDKDIIKMTNSINNADVNSPIIDVDLEQKDFRDAQHLPFKKSTKLFSFLHNSNSNTIKYNNYNNNNYNNRNRTHNISDNTNNRNKLSANTANNEAVSDNRNFNTEILTKSQNKLSECNNISNCNQILIVDDTETIRKSLIKPLQRNQIIKDNYNIVEAKDGIEILNKVLLDQTEGNKIKMIITDENMEYMSGSAAVSILRQLEKERKIHHIFICSLTAYNDECTKNQLLNKGIDFVINKPASIKEFDKLIEVFLNTIKDQ